MRPNLDYYKILSYSIIPLNIILIILLVIDFLGNLPVYWNSIYVFYTLIIVNTIFLALRLNHIQEYEREHDYTVFWSKYLFLLGLVVIAVNQFLKRDIITNNLSYIIPIIIAAGFLTFFVSRARVEQEIEDEKINEEREEERRKEEFAHRFSRINKIWGLRSIVKWMYKEGWEYSGALISIFILGFVLRVWNLGKLSFWVDETQSVVAARNFISTGIPYYQDNLIYLRAPFYTLFNVITIYLFGLTEFTIRLTPLLFSIITILWIYILLKKVISKKFALMGSLIFSISSYAILYARYNRFYIALGLLIPLNIYFFYRGFVEGNKKAKIISLILAFITTGFDAKSAIYFPILTSFLIIQDYKTFKMLNENTNYLNWITKKSILSTKLFLMYVIISLSSFFIFNKVDSINTIYGESIRTFKAERFTLNLPIPGFVKELIYPNGDSFFLDFITNYYPIILIALFCLLIISLVNMFYKNYNLNLRDLFIYYLMLNLLLLTKYYINIIDYTWDQRHFSFLFGILILNFTIFLVYLKKSIKISIYLFIIILILFISSISSIGQINSVINMNYGDTLVGTTNLVMKAEPYRSDYKNPYLYVNDHYKKGDIIIISDFGGNRYVNIYLNNSLNYSFFDQEGDNLVKLISENKNKRVWIIDITYDMEKHHAMYRWGESYNFMESNKDKIIYYGKDDKTRVYLFENA